MRIEVIMMIKYDGDDDESRGVVDVLTGVPIRVLFENTQQVDASMVEITGGFESFLLFAAMTLMIGRKRQDRLIQQVGGANVVKDEGEKAKTVAQKQDRNVKTPILRDTWILDSSYDDVVHFKDVLDSVMVNFFRWQNSRAVQVKTASGDQGCLKNSMGLCGRFNVTFVVLNNHE
eukprot:748071-Hanusia_phi.AAC.2